MWKDNIRKWIDKMEESAFVKAIGKVFHLFFGKTGELLWDTTRKEMEVADRFDIPGEKKFEVVYNKVKDEIVTKVLPDYIEEAITAAIKLGMIWLRSWIRNKI